MATIQELQQKYEGMSDRSVTPAPESDIDADSLMAFDYEYPDRDAEVEIAGRRIRRLGRTYADSDGLLALVGSHGYLEIAEANGDAAARLRAAVGTDVTVAVSRRAAQVDLDQRSRHARR